MIRSTVCAASVVCSVPNTKCPVSARVNAELIVSRSRISPMRMISGSCRRARLRESPNDLESLPISLEHVKDLDSLLSVFQKILNDDGTLIISGPTENIFYKFARKIATINIKGNLKGGEEHVNNIGNIQNTIERSGFVLERKINLWNLFHVLKFKKK